jgi:hypothetical protein
VQSRRRQRSREGESREQGERRAERESGGRRAGERVSEQRRRARERVTETEQVSGNWQAGERVMRGGSRRLAAGGWRQDWAGWRTQTRSEIVEFVVCEELIVRL